jgi:hypothetical protein
LRCGAQRFGELAGPEEYVEQAAAFEIAEVVGAERDG